MEDWEMATSSNGNGSVKRAINLGGEIPDISGQVHHLPCCIKFDGPSDVSHYFKPQPTGNENDGLVVKRAYFRGRELLGTTVPLPSGYSGYVIAKRNFGEEKDAKVDSQTWEARAKFSKVAFWNHDSLPSKDDTSLRSLHWLTVSDALHKPVTAEDLAALPE